MRQKEPAKKCCGLMQLQDLNRAALVPDVKEPKELRDTQENEAAHPVIKAHGGSL